MNSSILKENKDMIRQGRYLLFATFSTNNNVNPCKQNL